MLQDDWKETKTSEENDARTMRLPTTTTCNNDHQPQEDSSTYDNNNGVPQLPTATEFWTPGSADRPVLPVVRRGPDGSDSWPCRYCNKFFASRHRAERHEITHTKLKLFYCNLCNFQTSYKSCLMRHISTLHHNVL